MYRVENGGDRRVSERVEDLMPNAGPSGAKDEPWASDSANNASSSSLSSGVTPLSLKHCFKPGISAVAAGWLVGWCCLGTKVDT